VDPRDHGVSAGGGLRLFGHPSTASMIPHLLLRELDAPFEWVHVDRTRDAHKAPDDLRLNPNGLIPMLERVCDALRDSMHAVSDAGCDGVFYSINGAITPPAKRGIDDATYRTFVRPYEIRMAEAMAGMVRVLHVHGSSLTIERVLDCPFEVPSVSDRLKGNPTLAELRGLTDRRLMGGIDESSIIEMSLPEVRAQVRDAIAQAGRERFILSPGCTIPTQTPRYLPKALRETVETV
jgi:uroporphyrinogen decarboxylase